MSVESSEKIKPVLVDSKAAASAYSCGVASG